MQLTCCSKMIYWYIYIYKYKYKYICTYLYSYTWDLHIECIFYKYDTYVLILICVQPWDLLHIVPETMCELRWTRLRGAQQQQALRERLKGRLWAAQRQKLIAKQQLLVFQVRCGEICWLWLRFRIDIAIENGAFIADFPSKGHRN